MRTYCVWLSDGSDRDYTAKTINLAINKGFKIAKESGLLVLKIDDITDIETNEECPVIWKR